MSKVILDCDPGHDDAFAIMLAAKHLDLQAITTVGGNSNLEAVTRNALQVLEVINREDIPVYKGCQKPILGELTTAPQFHGESGLEGPDLKEPSIKEKDKNAVDFIVDTLLESKEKFTLIATGPLTNLANAINKAPKIVNNIEEIYIMGGSVTFGNWTPMSEFNIFVDPEAASIVFNSGAHVNMSGVNLTRQCLLTREHLQEIKKINTGAGKLAYDLINFFIGTTEKNSDLHGANLHDACAVAWMIDEKLVKYVDMHIDVELNGKLTRGMTVCDYRHLRGNNPKKDLYREPTMESKSKINASAGIELDFEGFLQLLYDTLKSYK